MTSRDTRRLALAFVPALLLVLGWVLLNRAGQQQLMALRAPLSTLPTELVGHIGRESPISEAEQRVAGMSAYMRRNYVRDTSSVFSVYVGYYTAQIGGASIHSPKNCLPGAGWEPVSSGPMDIRTADGETFRVNRYLIANGPSRALVYYWYQGRGRISANEYAVKWELLRDKAKLRRSEESLVRIVVPLTGSEEGADALAEEVAAILIPLIFEVMPEGPTQLAGPA